MILRFNGDNMTKFKLKLSLSDLMFFIPYTLYFLSFFLEDLPLEGSWFTIIKLIRYLSYALFMLDGVVISRNVLNLKAVSILALLAVYVGIMLLRKIPISSRSPLSYIRRRR